MKKGIVSLILVLCLTLMSFSALAGEMKVKVNQDGKVKEEAAAGDEDTSIEDEEDKDWHFDADIEGAKLNGGPMLGALQLNFSNLNEKLTDAGFKKFSEDYLILQGGGGIIGAKRGSRFGGYSLKGKLTTSASNGQKATLNVKYGGFLYEKGILASKKTGTDLAIGALMGGGSAQLNLLYGEIEGDFGSVISNAQMTNLSKEFVLLQPRINLHQQIASFVGLDLGVGYLLTYDFGENWKLNEKSISGPLENYHAPTLDLKLSFGF